MISEQATPKEKFGTIETVMLAKNSLHGFFMFK